MKAAVWFCTSTLTKFYLRDFQNQKRNLHFLGPFVVAQKVMWLWGGWGVGRSGVCMCVCGGGGGGS